MSAPTTPTGSASVYMSALGDSLLQTSASTASTASSSSASSGGAPGAASGGGGAAVKFDLDFNLFVQLLNQGRLHKDSQYHGVPLLHYASFHARQDIVRELLTRGALLTAVPGRNLSPLHFLCNKQHVLCSAQEQACRADIVRMLVSNAVQLDIQESRGWTALKFAVRNGLVKCVEALLDCNANADLADEDGFAPLHNAVVVASELPGDEGCRMLQLLLRRVHNVNSRNARRHTPLLLALLQRDTRSAEMLLHYGADPNAMDADGNTPLIVASQLGDDNLVSVLLSRGAHVNLVSSCRQRTALHYTVETGVSSIVRLLLRKGADVYIRDSMGDTPLSLATGSLLELMRACAAVQAVESGDGDRLSELYRDGLDINAISVASKSPLLHHAACSGQPDIVHFLLRNGAFVNEANADGHTALHFACVSELPHRNYAETLRQLLNNGADINAQNNFGDTPLHLAAERGFNLRVSMLLKTAGAHQLIVNKRGELALHKACCCNQALMSVFILLEDLQTHCLNKPCNGGWTPLMFACKSRSVDIVQYLLDDCGADVNATQGDGYTALHIAVQARRDDVRRQLCTKLIEHKANPNAPAGTKKLTPVHYACAKGMEEICILFAENGGDFLLPDAESDSALSMIPSTPAFDSLRLKLQDYTKQCDDLDLIKEWTNHPARSSPNPINMVTASAEECRYDSLPRHQELAATLAADGSIVVPKTEGDGGGEADKMDIPVPRLRLREAARQVARRIFRLHGGVDGDSSNTEDTSPSKSGSDVDERHATSRSLGQYPTSKFARLDGDMAITTRARVGSADNSMHRPLPKQRGPLTSSLKARQDSFASMDDGRTRTIKGDVDIPYATLGSLQQSITGDDDTLRLKTNELANGGIVDSSDAIRHLFMGMHDLSKQIKTTSSSFDEVDDLDDSLSSTPGLMQIQLSELTRDTVLGSGSYSEVYRSTYRSQPVAVKLFRNMSGDEVKKVFQQEVLMLSKMSHPNVLKIIGYCEDVDGHAIVTDLLERGSLQDVLHDNNLDLPWTRRIHMLQQASLGMQYLHKCQLLHRDLKSGNLLVSITFNVKVADFGMSKVRQHTVTMTTNFRGSPAYIAPETFDTKSHSEASDVYAFGIILYEVASRKLPYHEHRSLRVMELMMSVLRGNRPTLELEGTESGPIPDDYVDLMNQCWHEDFRQRPNFTEVVASLRRIMDSISRK